MGARRSAAAVAMGLSFLFAFPTSASARPADRRVIVVLVEPATVDSWRQDAALAALLREGSIALVSTRTARDETDPAARADAAVATLGAGARETAGEEGNGLAEALHTSGVPFVASPSIQRVLAASRLRTVAGAVPGDLAAPAVAVVDARSDTAAVTRARELLKQDDVLVVLSPVPARGIIRLGVVAIAGSRVPAGLLHSTSTRRDGVVTLADVAPSVLDILAIGIPRSMEGRPVTTVARADGLDALASLERAVVVAANARRPSTRGALVATMIALAIGVACLRAGPVLRRSAALLVLACMATPLALYVAGALRPDGTTGVLVTAAIVCVVLAIGSTLLGSARAPLVILMTSAVVPIVDLLAGTPLGVRSPLAFQIAGGGRFYGVDDAMLGVVVGAIVFAAGMALDIVADRRVLWFLAAWAAATVWVLGSPSFGSKFGAALTAVPAIGVLAARARGRIDARAVVGIGVVALLGTVLFVLADAVRDPELQSHVGRATEGRGDVSAMVGRKVRATWRITTSTIWTPAVITFVASLGLMRWRARARWDAVLSARGYRSAMLGAAVGATAGLLFNDEGIITATPILLYAATTTMVLVLAREQPPQANRSEPRPQSPLAASN